MNKFSLKDSITDEDLMIYVLNKLPKEYDVVLDGFKNRLTVSGDDALTIDVICEKLKHCYKKLKTKIKKTDKKKRP